MFQAKGNLRTRVLYNNFPLKGKEYGGAGRGANMSDSTVNSIGKKFRLSIPYF